MNTDTQTPSPDRLPLREPAVDIWSDDDRVLLVAEVPGATTEGLSLRLENRVLHLDARSPTHRYRRAFSVGMAVEKDALTAELRHGLLTVSLPRAAHEKPRQIPVVEA